MILNNFFYETTQKPPTAISKSRGNNVGVKTQKSGLKRVVSAVGTKRSSQNNIAGNVSSSNASQKEKSLNAILGLRNESIAEKYFAMTQEQKSKRHSVLDNYSEFDDMINNYLQVHKNATNINHDAALNYDAGISAQKSDKHSQYTRTSTKNLLLQGTAPYDSYSNSANHSKGEIQQQVQKKTMSSTKSETVIRNWVYQNMKTTTSDEFEMASLRNRGGIVGTVPMIQEDRSDNESMSGYSDTPSLIDERNKRNKAIYMHLTEQSAEMTKRRGDLSHTEISQNQQNQQSGQARSLLSQGFPFDEDDFTSKNKTSFANQSMRSSSKQGSSALLYQDNSSHITDMTTTSTVPLSTHKMGGINSQNIEIDQNCPSYAMGTIVSNNKSNTARRVSKNRPGTAMKSATAPVLAPIASESSQAKQFGQPFAGKYLLREEDEGDDSREGSAKNTSNPDRIAALMESCQEHEDVGIVGDDGVMIKEDGDIIQDDDDDQSEGDADNYDNGSAFVKDCENILMKIQKRDSFPYSNGSKKDGGNIYRAISGTSRGKQNVIVRGVSPMNSRPQSVKKSGLLMARSRNNEEDQNIPTDRFEHQFRERDEEEIADTLTKLANDLLEKQVRKEKATNGVGSNSNGGGRAAAVVAAVAASRAKTEERMPRGVVASSNINSNQKLATNKLTSELSRIPEQNFEGEGWYEEAAISTPNVHKKNPLGFTGSQIPPRSMSSFKKSSTFNEKRDLTYSNIKEEGKTSLLPATTAERNSSMNNHMNGSAAAAAAAAASTTTITNPAAKIISAMQRNNKTSNHVILARPDSKRLSMTATEFFRNNPRKQQLNTPSEGMAANALDQFDFKDKENLILSRKDNTEGAKLESEKVAGKYTLNKPAVAARPATAAALAKDNSNSSTNKLMERYEMKCTIGKGSYAVVKLAKDSLTDRNVAIKMYDKHKLMDPQKRNNVKREIAILNKLDHVNIIKLYATVDTRSSVNLVMEYISSVSLRQFMKDLNGRQLEERYAKQIFRQLVQAVAFCHEWDVIHRDIKLENIMLETVNSYMIKLIDFGFAIRIANDKKLNIFCGTPTYMSPEITKKKEYFGKPADIWSLGIVLYALVCGRFPFKGKDDNELFKKIQSGEFKYTPNSSQSGQKLISRILRIVPEERPTAREILSDRWLTDY